MTYLAAFTDWVNTDPWPRDERFSGPALTPAAIERKLRVSELTRATRFDYDADDLAAHCRRLVILGPPGSGKTWLAKRTARRCAEKALDALAAGDSLDDIELPLYTTCSKLFSADGDIREAIVSSALMQISDLGSSRLIASLRTFFTERTSATLLVIDALDEALGPDERLRQADTLRAPWRIVLTSRPSSWNQQLIIDNDHFNHVGELQPLRYPTDVEPFIQNWFHQRPEWGRNLAAQIAQRRHLQEAATVPLILAFYCILGGRQPLPSFTRDLYSRVLKRILTGRWRGWDGHQPHVDDCLRALQGMAWSATSTQDPSGLGYWPDVFHAQPVRLGEAERNAVDHIAVPIALPDIDTDRTARRFIHHSMREHLVAEYVAGLPVMEAAEVLLPHLWYDPEWEYACPAAVAMHPQNDQLLRELIRRTMPTGLNNGSLYGTDACSGRILGRRFDLGLRHRHDRRPCSSRSHTG